MTTGTPQPMDPGRRNSGPASPRRRRGVALLPLAAVAWALLELWLLLWLGRTAGGLAVFLVLVGSVLLGVVVINRAGRRAWQRMMESLHKPPASGAPGTSGASAPRASGGNGTAMAGGLLLIIPGLLSDVLGLLCIFPPTAALVRRGAKRVLITGAGPLGTIYEEVRAADQQMRMRRQDGNVVQGEVVEDQEPPDDRPGEDPPRIP